VSALHVWTIVDHGERHHVIAASAPDALAVLHEQMGCEADPGASCVELYNAAELTIRNDDGARETRTCSEWVAANGRGMLASTCF